MKSSVSLRRIILISMISVAPLATTAQENAEIWTHLISPTDGQEVIGETVPLEGLQETGI